MFEAVYGIHWQGFIVREVYGFNDSSAPVRSVAKKIDEVVYLTIAGKFNGDVFPCAVFAVNIRCFSAYELIEEANSGLRYVIAIRYDMVYTLFDLVKRLWNREICDIIPGKRKATVYGPDFRYRNA